MFQQEFQATLDVLDRSLKFLNSACMTVLFGVGVYFLIAEFPTFKSGVDELIGRFGQVQSVEIVNLKVVFGEANILEQLPVYKTLEKEDSQKLSELRLDLRDLRPEWFPRLLNVGAQNKLCDFERPTPDMQQSRDVDQQLARMNLVELQVSVDDRSEVLREMAAAKAARKEWKIGAPRSCYRATLTDRGWNIRTAVVEYLTVGLASAPPAPASEARGLHNVKLAAQ